LLDRRKVAKHFRITITDNALELHARSCRHRRRSRAKNNWCHAVYVCIDPLVNTHRIRINTLALAARLPTMHAAREYVEAGGLMSYGPNFPHLFRRATDYVDKILRGAKPGEIPVEQPTKFDLVINLTAAKALGLSVPETLVARPRTHRLRRTP
jgi:ABC-type uncharacterized transport system substrate-binding protein